MDLQAYGCCPWEEVINSLNGKRVLVTGACGFIGPNLIAELVEQGAVVTALDVATAKWEKITSKKVARVETDIMNPADLSGACKGIEIVYHLAARTDINSNKVEDYAVNYAGTANLVKEAAKAKTVKRFMFYSTQLVVGLFNETRFIDATEPYRTKTAYGQSKIEGEKVVKSACKKAGIPFTIIRPTSVYGPWGEEPYKQFFQTIKARRYFHVGKANNLVSLVYVKNLVDLTILSSLEKQAEGQIYFGNDFHPYTMREFVDQVAAYYGIKVGTIPNIIITPVAYFLGIFKLLGLAVPIYPFRLKNIKANYCYDIQSAIDIGYRPKYDLAAGVTETLDWYEKTGSI